MAQQYQQPQAQQYQQPEGQQYQQPQDQRTVGQQPQRQQQPTGGQFGGTGQQTGGQQGQQIGQQSGQQQVYAYDEMLPNDMRTALHDFSHLKKSCEWAAEQVHGQMPGETEIPRTLEDLAEIAELNEKLIVRDSRHGPEVAQTFLTVAQDDLQQLQQVAQQQPILTTVVSDLQRAINSTTQLLGSIGQQVGGQQSIGQQSGGQQSGGQQMGGQRSVGQQSIGQQGRF
ncbi:hypothetical protein [Haladaptatus sp. DFWS20]|uniref:hypothetical protein n=1 Tax=Haladaptatus sp. DFWS20 TaxID=3403467 RepID=UPI003EC0947D